MGIKEWKRRCNPTYTPEQEDRTSRRMFVIFIVEHLEREVVPRLTQDALSVLCQSIVLSFPCKKQIA